jgi:hypothetical protein
LSRKGKGIAMLKEAERNTEKSKAQNSFPGAAGTKCHSWMVQRKEMC